MLKKLVFFLACLSFVFCSSTFAQRENCAPPPIVANAKAANMFTTEQEMILGDLTVQRLSGDVRLIKDERLLAYVNAVGERLVKHLPPTGLKFQFHIVDIPDANAFNIPGGHVFLSRKLIGFAANEDELAGVMAHELGHATVHHAATDMSERFRKILNVSALGDRRDIAEKYNLLIENWRTKSFAQKGGHENEQQLEADRIGLFALIAAGYDPSAFAAFFDRLTESGGKTGGWFSSFFSKTTPNQKRLREMIQLTEQTPQACRDGRGAQQATDGFLKWQAETVSYRKSTLKEQLPGLLWKRELAPKLRSDVSRLSVSPDGRRILAQDDFSLTIIERDSATGQMRILFQIPIENIDDAFLTADGKSVVFTTNSLRFEKWSIDKREPTEVRELVLRRDCLENRLSPDGNYLACVDTAMNLNLLDTRTGKRVWQKKEFYQLNYFEYISWIYSNTDDGRKNFFRIEFSPDARYAMFSRSNYFRFRTSLTGANYGYSSDAALALDLTTLKPVGVGGEMEKVAARSYVFLDAQRVLGMPTGKAEDAGVFSFPAGKRLQKFNLYAQEIKATGNPDYFVIKPLSNAMMGIFDLKKAVLAAGVNKADATLWNDVFIFESTAGKIVARQIESDPLTGKHTDGKEVAAIDIPVAAVGNLSAAQVSNNFKWLALSSKTRGGMWNLETGERKIFVRGYRGGVVADNGGGIGEFPKLDEAHHTLVIMNPLADEVSVARELPEAGAKQFGRFVLVRSSMKEKKEDNAKKKDDKNPISDVPVFDDSADFSLSENVRFEVKDFVQDKVVWSRDFPKGSPRYSFDAGTGRLILYWLLGTDAGKAKLKETPDLQAKADSLGNKDSDYLIEVVDAFAGGKTVGTLLVETGKGSFGVGAGLSAGDWLVLYDSQDRVIVFSLKTGELRQRFFGKNAALNPRRNQIAVENFPGEVSVYDLETGDAQTNFVIGGSASFIKFNQEGNKMFVLSDAQAAYAFDLGKPAAAAPVAAKSAQE